MKRQQRNVQVHQNSINRTNNVSPMRYPFLAEVTDAMSDRMACHLKTVDGFTLYNVPVMINGGVIDGAPYGERCLPNIGDWVLVMWAGKYDRQQVIVGSFVPYLTSEFQADGPNSASKAFTKKLIEADKELHDVRIFKSGTTWEVEEDGTLVIETPSGAYIQIDEANDKLVINDQYDNKVTMDTNGMKLEDKNGNDVTMGATSVTVNSNLEVLQ